jgi:DNA-binding transcriptional MerR regulator
VTFSIGDVLEQLSDEFPDITVSKIRFLESQGLIAPMRTASGFRMFSDTDITKLKWILLHQRDRFLPLKVIKEYLSTMSDDDFADGNLPSFDFEGSGALALEGTETEDTPTPEPVSHLAPVPDLDPTGEVRIAQFAQRIQNSEHKAAAVSTLVQESPVTPTTRKRPDAASTRKVMKPVSTMQRDSLLARIDCDALIGTTEMMTAKKAKPRKDPAQAVMTLEAMTIETGISGPVLKELVKFGVLEGSGTGNAIVFSSDDVALAHVVAPLLEQGIEVRHIKNYALFAAREVGFLEHVVQDDLRKRNPQALEAAHEKAKQFIQDTARLKEMLLLKAMKKESQ